MPRPKSPPKKKTHRKRKYVVKKSEVAKIAKASVKQMAEKKFFKTAQVITFPEPSERYARNFISAIGFCTTSSANPSTTPNVDLCFPMNQKINSLDMLTPYFSTEPDPAYSGYAPDGKSLQPVSAKCRWNIQKDFTQIFADPEWLNVPSFNKQVTNNLYTDIRMIQVTPKTAPGSLASNLDPRLDLFVDSYGNACGIDSANVIPIPDNNEMFHNKVNTRRYEVIADKKFVLGNPLTLQYQRSFAGDYDGRYEPAVSNVNKNCELNVTTYHKLSQRKNGKVYYAEEDLALPTNGFRREYVFWLFKHRAGDSLINAIGLDASMNTTPTNILLKAIPESKFIDV